MRIVVLLVVCVLLLVSGCNPRRNTLTSGYTQGRGDAGQFILQHALAYGARPIKTNGLPAVHAEWEYVQDEFGIGLVLSPSQYQPTYDFVRAAFGPPSNQAGWSARDFGAAIMVRKETGSSNTLVGIYPPMSDEKRGQAAKVLTDTIKKNTQ